MYYAKKQGRNTCKFYFKKMNADVSRMMKLEYGMVRAIENGEFEIYYQPVIDIESTAIVSAEALLRWNHPEFGVVSSLEFIPIAEETGQIVRLGNWVLENACRQNKLWQDAGMPKAAVCVNVSRRQLKDSCFVNIVCGVLKETGLDPKYLELEITESILHDSGDHMQVLKELKAAGVRIAIDDFGSGYSSLGALQYMDVDSFKIDRDIIKSIADNRKSEAIVGMVVRLGKSLGLRVIAEGIEDERQKMKLKDLSCDCGQGYLFSRPVPAKDFEKLLSDAVDAHLNL
jgi:EAL domain-containing protein (putative c-di-GMP-specific phosphodiesterase class I)